MTTPLRHCTTGLSCLSLQIWVSDPCIVKCCRVDKRVAEQLTRIPQSRSCAIHLYMQTARLKARMPNVYRWSGQRALQRWEPAPGEEGLEELESGTTFEPGWNQFELNEAKFGVQSTWDEVGGNCCSAARNQLTACDARFLMVVMSMTARGRCSTSAVMPVRPVANPAIRNSACVMWTSQISPCLTVMVPD